MEPTQEICEFCGKPLEKYAIPALFGSRGRTITVECDCDGARASRRKDYVDKRSGVLREAWVRTDIPKRYQDVKPDIERAKMLVDGHGFYFYGERGTGKTTAAAAILKGYVAGNLSQSGYASARYVSAPAWLDAICDTFGRYGVSAEDEFQRAAGVKVLLLDDLGKLTTRTSPQAIGRLFRLIDVRYSEMRSTIITSRFRLDQLAARLESTEDPEIAADMISRIYEVSEKVEMNGADLRLGRPA